MGFPQKIADEVLVRCSRHCCLCGVYAGSKIELHHIKQVADGGDDSAENCIPLCLNCHAEVKAYNPHHPKGRKFTETELKGHRDKYYALFSSLPNHPEEHDEIKEGKLHVFPPKENIPVTLWGYPEQDKACYLLPGKMLLIAGYTGTRKSTYVQHIVNTNLCRGQRIAYCCLKDNPLDVAIEIIAENSCLNAVNVKRGELTEDGWRTLSLNQHQIESENLVLFPYNEVAHPNQVLSVVESSGAEVVIIDDMNGLLFDDDIAIERFMYQLKNVASGSNTIVIAIYNMPVPSRRGDMRPMLSDFPSNSYYRLFDIVQFMFKPSDYYDVETLEEETVEAIFVKGTIKTPCVVKMYAPSQITHVIPVDVER